jgi:hypothetical protein
MRRDLTKQKLSKFVNERSLKKIFLCYIGLTFHWKGVGFLEFLGT